MTHYLIFAFGIFVGVFLGIFIVGLLFVGRERDDEEIKLSSD